MVKRGSDIIGLPVICLNEGCKTLEIKDILFCNYHLQIIAFVIDEGGYFHNPKIIKFENVKKIGEDAVTIINFGSIEEIWDIKKDYESFDSREKMLGIEVVTDNGKAVGIVQDIVMDESTGALLGLILSESLFDDLVEGRPILPLRDPLDMNKSTIIISEKVNQLILHHTGGLKKILSIE